MIKTVDESPPVEILLVEDNPGDFRLTKEALHEGKVYNNLHWVKDGVEALMLDSCGHAPHVDCRDRVLEASVAFLHRMRATP